MARLPQSFDEAFNSIHAVLVEQLHVSTSLLNRFLDSNLLNQHHVDELKVYSLSLYSSNFDIDVRQSNHSVEIGWWLVCFHCTMLLPRAVDLCYGNCVCLLSLYPIMHCVKIAISSDHPITNVSRNCLVFKDLIVCRAFLLSVYRLLTLLFIMLVFCLISCVRRLVITLLTL